MFNDRPLALEHKTEPSRLRGTKKRQTMSDRRPGGSLGHSGGGQGVVILSHKALKNTTLQPHYLNHKQRTVASTKYTFLFLCF